MLAILLIASGAALPYPSVTPSQLQSGDFDGKRIKMEATVVECFVDELDPRYVFFVLRNAGEDVYAYIFRKSLAQPPETLVGAEIMAWGMPHAPHEHHLYAQRLFDIPKAEALVVTRPAPDPFAAPDISTAEKCLPAELYRIGRMTAKGEVIAVWNGGKSILLAVGDKRVRADLAAETPPATGERVAVSGRPETDLRNLNLSRAVWRRDESAPAADLPDSERMTLRQMHTDKKSGLQAFVLGMHGRPVRVSGIVHSLPNDGIPGMFTCGDGKFTITVDASAAGPLPSFGIGDTVEIDGVALCECRNFRPSEVFPQIQGYTVVPRSASDVRVTAHPARPIPNSVWYMLGALISALGGVVLWNRSLKRLATKRGNALAEERIARAEAELKTIERTRISTELHDTIAQNLTGAALEIETAMRNQPPDSHISGSLSRAASTIASCRNELRNCLWDLRNDALEEKDMDAAVRRTLLPHLKGVTLHVRFNVARDRISDNTAHAILQIVRELSVNAIRHGEADTLHIAGVIDNGQLLVSVRDNGKGFDTDKAPGVEEGHFGLDGIRSRVDRLNGVFEIQCAPGRGTYAAIRIPAPQEENGDEESKSPHS